MKNIDIKSLIIGVLLTSTIFLGVAAAIPKGTGKFLRSIPTSNQWDDKQQWSVISADLQDGMGKITGYQPFAVDATKKGLPMYYYRKRTK